MLITRCKGSTCVLTSLLFTYIGPLFAYIKEQRAVSYFPAGCFCGGCRSNIPLVCLYSYSHQVFWLRMSIRGRPKGHWWLIFWALTDCVSNGALIAFAPPSLQTSPKKSIQIPTRKLVPGERRSGPSLKYSERHGIGLMCNLKSISLKKCPSYLRQHHLNINRASCCFTQSWVWEETGALTKDFTLSIQRNQVLTASLSILIRFHTLCMRFNKVAECLSSQVYLQSFHIPSKSQRKVLRIPAEGRH